MGEQADAVVALLTPSTDSPPHVLISDPNPVGRSRVSAILQANGIPADTAETAQEVLAATEADTVLLSLDGAAEEQLELIRKLRGFGLRRPAVVVMSGQSNALLPRALDAGADDYLITPARPEELIVRLRVVGDRRRLEAEQATATIDPLTGLLNRGAFHQRLDEEVMRSARHGRLLSLAVLDVDHLKQVNGAHGRQAGDKALAAVAGLARSHARETDVVGRVGGGQVAWLMPETDLDGAAQAAERLRAFIAATPTCGGRVTASLGVAELGADGPEADLFASADAAMYGAKEAGRNCVRVSRAGTPESH